MSRSVSQVNMVSLHATTYKTDILLYIVQAVSFHWIWHRGQGLEYIFVSEKNRSHQQWPPYMRSNWPWSVPYTTYGRKWQTCIHSPVDVFCLLLLMNGFRSIQHHTIVAEYYYTPRKLCLWGYTVFTLSVRPWRFGFSFNILKRQWWKFIKLCRHIDIVCL